MLSRPLVVLCAALAAAPALAVPSLAAQAPAGRGPTRLGVLAGVNRATLRGDDDGDVGTRTGFVGGVTLSLPLTAALAFRPELLYATKGAETSSRDDGTPVTARVTLPYVEIPLLLAADLPVGGRVRPQLYAGPAVAFRVGCRSELSGGGLSIRQDCDDLDDADEEVALKSFDVGALVGGALVVALPRGAVSVGARYTFGLTRITDDGPRNRVLGVVASYEVPIGR